MKRSPMPARRTSLRSNAPLVSRCELQRRTPIKPVSDKRARLNRQRTEVLRPIREAQQWCARCGRTGCGLDAHELVRRSQYAAGVIDENVIVLLCRDCHDWVTVNPEAAHAAGWTLWGWEHRQGATA
jgi:hypothetical protein